MVHSPVTGFSNVENGQNVRVHGTVGSAAIHVDRALNAPKLDTVNEQIRAPVTSNQYGVGAMTVQTAISTDAAPLPHHHHHHPSMHGRELSWLTSVRSHTTHTHDTQTRPRGTW